MQRFMPGLAFGQVASSLPTGNFWTPARLSAGTVLGWWRAKDLAAAGAASGDEINTLPSTVAGGQAMNALSSSLPVFYKDDAAYRTPNGSPCVLLDHRLMGTNTPVTTARENIMLYVVGSTLAGGRVHFSQGDNTGWALTHVGGNSFGWGGLAGGAYWFDNITPAAPQWQAQSLEQNSATGKLSLFRDGAMLYDAPLPLPNAISGRTLLGGDSFGMITFLFAEALIIALPSSSADRNDLRANMNQYLKREHGTP